MKHYDKLAEAYATELRSQFFGTKDEWGRIAGPVVSMAHRAGHQAAIAELRSEEAKKEWIKAGWIAPAGFADWLERESE